MYLSKTVLRFWRPGTRTLQSLRFLGFNQNLKNFDLGKSMSQTKTPEFKNPGAVFFTTSFLPTLPVFPRQKWLSF